MEDLHDLVHGFQERVGDAGARRVPGRVMSIPCTVAVLAAACGRFESSFDLLLELVEADAQGFFGFWWGRF